jgi:hypothetical protein
MKRDLWGALSRAVRSGLVLCCLGSALLFSEWFVASQGLAAHDCPGEGCPLCLLVQGAQHCSRQLRQAPALPVLPPGVLLPGPRNAGFCACYAVSAVRLKVRINT